MAASLNTNGVLYGDSSQQNTAFLGGRATVYTSSGSGTFTIPTGITAIKVTVVGGGGGSVYYVSCVPVQGGTGGTSSVSSGTQTISTISATGGVGNNSSNTPACGVGSGGDLNGYGYGSAASRAGGSIISGTPNGGATQAGVLGSGGSVGSGALYPGAAGGHAIKWLTGLTPGNTLNYSVGAGGTVGGSGGAAGGAGVIIFEY